MARLGHLQQARATEQVAKCSSVKVVDKQLQQRVPLVVVPVTGLRRSRRRSDTEHDAPAFLRKRKARTENEKRAGLVGKFLELPPPLLITCAGVFLPVSPPSFRVDRKVLWSRSARLHLHTLPGGESLLSLRPTSADS